jgi:hypothetical protein
LEIADDAQIGIRGSMIRGLKGPQKGFEPFDPNKFDVDAFIISDKLAAAKNTKNVRGFRFSIDKEITTIQKDIQRSLKAQFPGLKGGKDKFSFRIFTQQEFSKKFGPQSPFIIVE